MPETIVVAGATGNLGQRIAYALLERGATVRAIIRPDTDPAKAQALADRGVQLAHAAADDVPALTEACRGAACLVSAVQGLREVIVDAQTHLLEAAVAAGVPRFIPSDFSVDFTPLPAGNNRNFDLRREFRERLDQANIKATSVFNGAFAYILKSGAPLLDMKKHSVTYSGDADWQLDFTTLDNTAAYTAAAALDQQAPRALHIASFQTTPHQLADLAGEVVGEPFALHRMGSVAELLGYARHQRAEHPEGEHELYPRWQQMQYMVSMYSTHHPRLDNDRYPGIEWTSAREFLAEK